MGNVRERPRVHEGELLFERLEYVRHDRVFEENRHGAGDTEVFGGYGLAGLVEPEHDAADAAAQVGHIHRQGQDGHDLAGDGDVEAGFAQGPVVDAAHADDDAAQRPVVHVEHAVPPHLVGIDIELMQTQLFEIGLGPSRFVVHARVERRRTEVVGSGYRVDVARQVKIEIGHGHDLRIAAAGGPALDAEGRAHRGLPDRRYRLFADEAEALREPDGRRGFALAQGRGRYRSDIDVFRAHLSVANFLDELEPNFGLVRAVMIDVFLAYTVFFRHIGDRPDIGFLSDIDVAGNGFTLFH